MSLHQILHIPKAILQRHCAHDDPRDPQVDSTLAIAAAREAAMRERLSFLEQLIDVGDIRGFDIFFEAFSPEERQMLVLHMSMQAWKRADFLLRRAGL